MKYIISILRYLGALVLLGLCWIGGVGLFPFIYWFRYADLLWWWWDDEDGLYGAEYWRKAKGITKKNFWVAYRWAGLRNPMWNAHTKIRPSSKDEVLIKGYGQLTRNGEVVAITNSACINFEDDQGNYEGNAGTNFSTYFSYLGWAFVWIYKDKQIHWRFSLAKRLIGKWWIQYQLGSFHRYIFKIKLTAKNN